MGRHPEEAPTELMTEAEHKVMDLLGQIWNELVTNVVADEGGRNVDTKELMFHIHGLQRAVMAQAACRAYPGEYRLLGADALGKKELSLEDTAGKHVAENPGHRPVELTNGTLKCYDCNWCVRPVYKEES